MSRKIDNVLVLGAGLMGSGIAQVIATAGYRVTLADVHRQATDRGRDRINDSLRRLVAAGRIESQAPAEILERLTFSVEGLDVAPAHDLVIESVVEDLELKQRLFRDLDAQCARDVILATNTSQYPISAVAQDVGDPSRVIGMHWSNPPPLMPLVEVIASNLTSKETLDRTLSFVDACGHQTVICKKDVPGFISTRLYQALVLEAVRIVDEGLATAADVDSVAKLMHGHRMGPIASLDFAGLDTALRVSEELSKFYGSRFNAPRSLKALVDMGHTGRKSGRGFYEY